MPTSHMHTLPPDFGSPEARDVIDERDRLRQEVFELRRALHQQRASYEQLRDDFVRLSRDHDALLAGGQDTFDGPSEVTRVANPADYSFLDDDSRTGRREQVEREGAAIPRPVRDRAPTAGRAAFDPPPFASPSGASAPRGGSPTRVATFATPVESSVNSAPRAAFEARVDPRVPSAVSPDQGIDFGAVQRLSPEELDALPYGLITLDAEGRVVHYNDTESRLVGLPKDRVIGKNFFEKVAPCTRVREFEGRFRELVLDPTRVRVKTFDFVFRFARGEQHVTIVMTPARTRGLFHMALVRRATPE